MSETFSIGQLVEVSDEGLAMLRKLGAPANHHGRVAEIWDDGTILVEFPIGGTYKHSQVAPYPPELVRKRS